MKDADLEKKFLELVFTTDTPITVGAVAFHTGCTLEEAEAYLDKLATAGRLRIENDDDGDIFYVYPKRTKIQTPVPPTRALVPAVELRPAPRAILNPGTAAVLSFLWPGAGQLYAGRIGAGIGWMMATVAGYIMLVVPGLIIHFFCIVSAARAAREVNERGGAG